MQSFSRCIHFLKASRYADLGTVIRYWWMADPSACRDWYFRPARNAFNFGNKKKSHGARSGEYVFVVLSGDAFALFHWHFYCDSFTREEDCMQNLLCTQRMFGNYWAFAVFSGPDLIANLSDGLKIMGLGFITSDDIGKLLFVIFWKHLKQLFGHFNPLPLLLVSQQMWHPSSRNLSDFQMLLQNKVNRW